MGKRMNPAQIAMALARKKLAVETVGMGIRVQMIWAYSMLQCGLSPKTVNRVREYANKVAAEKFTDLREDGVAEQWMREQLDAEGVHFKPVPKISSLDF